MDPVAEVREIASLSKRGDRDQADEHWVAQYLPQPRSLRLVRAQRHGIRWQRMDQDQYECSCRRESQVQADPTKTCRQ